MEKILTAANANRSFGEVMSDKERKLIDDALGPILYLMEQAGLPNHKIADGLFRFFTAFAKPPENADEQAAVVWYAQLQRYRDDLNRQISLIDSTLAESHD
ncbi:MAG: hypothetical protein AAF530_19840 [Pseudomonadota bacterium]